MKIFITGANGMLGSSLCRLYHNNHETYTLHRDEGCFTDCSADYSLDLINTRKVEELFNKIKPDLVIHCAGLTNVDTCEKEPRQAHDANVTITENISRACSKSTILIYISTDQVYGEVEDYSETNTNLQPVNQYGITKLQGEQKVEEFCNSHLIIRTNIFGLNVKPERVSSAEWIYNSLKNEQELNLFTDYTFSPIYTEYLGKILMQLVVMDSRGIFNVGSQSPCSKYDFGLHMAEESGLNSSVILKGSIADHSFPASRFNKLDLDVRKLSCLSIIPPDYRLSIRQFVRDRKKRADNY
jgi:dTDP-4-dehydrorhamnose reductase